MNPISIMGRALTPILLILLALLAAVPAVAQESAGTVSQDAAGTDAQSESEPSQRTLRLSEADAVDRAVAENLSLRRQRTTLEIQERQTETAWNVFIPSVSASTSLRRQSQEVPVAPPGEPYQTTLSASVSAQLTLVASIANEIESATHNLSAQRMSYEQAKQQTAQQVRTLFYTLLLAQERIAVRETAVETSEQNVQQVQASYEEGRVQARTVRQAELSLEQARLQLQQSRAGLEDSMATFKGLLGIAPDRTVELAGALPTEASAEESVPELRSGSKPSVARLASQIESQQESLEAARKNRWWPSLSVSASYSPGLEGYTGFPDPFNAENPPNAEWNNSGSISISLSYGLDRLLPFSQQAVSVESAERQLAAAQLERQSAVEQARREYDSLMRSVENARSAVESQRLNVSLNEEVVSLTEEAYEAGQSDFISLQEAQVQLAEARLAFLNEAFNLRTTLIELEYASGQPAIE